MRLGFTGRPILAQGARGFFEPIHVLGDRVAADRQRCLAFYPLGQGRQAAVQMLQAAFLELAEDLEVVTTAGKEGARAEEQLVEVAVRLHA
ncbi:hypothetical protein D3C80_1188180 [compost metagenome]